MICVDISKQTALKNVFISIPMQIKTSNWSVVCCPRILYRIMFIAICWWDLSHSFCVRTYVGYITERNSTFVKFNLCVMHCNEMKWNDKRWHVQFFIGAKYFQRVESCRTQKKNKLNQWRRKKQQRKPLKRNNTTSNGKTEPSQVSMAKWTVHVRNGWNFNNNNCKSNTKLTNV